MKLPFRFYSCIARLRFKAYRIGARLVLGDLFNSVTGLKLCRNLDEISFNEQLKERVLHRELVANAFICNYPFPKQFSTNFPRSEAFTERTAYLLSDVIASPHMGAMWFDQQCFLQQSLGSIPRITGWGGGIKDTLLPVKEYPHEHPVTPLANVGYYHVLLESIPQALHALKLFPDTKLLIPESPRKHLISTLKFLGLSDRIIKSNYPLRLNRGVLVPRWVNGGFIPQEDIDILRSEIYKKLPEVSSQIKRKIYISRSKCPNRSIVNEKELEHELTGLGFEILHFEDLSFADQMQTISETSTVIAPHGSGLANMIAGRSGLHVHELIFSILPNTCYAKMAVQMGFDYSYSLLDTDSHGELKVDVNKVVSALEKNTIL